MKYIMILVMLCITIFAQPQQQVKTPVEFFGQYDLKILFDSSAKFITVTNTTNIPVTILQDVAYALNIYQRYNSIFPENRLNGVNWWIGNKNIVFDRFWFDTYVTSSRSTKMNLIYIKLITELDVWIPKVLQESRYYQRSQ